MQHAIDLRRHHFMHEFRDLVVFGTWLHNEDQEDTEPALVILPRYRRAKPVVIALSSAYKYNDPVYLARASAYFSKVMGFDDGLSTAYRIAEAIDNNLLDLLKMPVDPTETVQVGEAVLDLGNGAKQTVGLMDYEQIKA